MSVMPHEEPQCDGTHSDVELEIKARKHDLGDGFTVGRVLPAVGHRQIGPFTFFDHMGPVQLPAGVGLDVRPHPHINLATVTYLFEGEIVHRDSLGSEQTIRPGAVNWMTAGRGIVHSERSPASARTSGARVHGLQLWVALPQAHEEDEPSFQHHPAESIPALERPGVRLRLIAGAAYGAQSPVAVCSPLFYVEALLEPGAVLQLPEEYEARAAYVVSGSVTAAGTPRGEGTLVVFRKSAPACLTATGPAHVMLLGGAPLDGERYMYWNFVSSSKERIERAKADWQGGRFPKVPGDDQEFIPLPTSSR